MQIFQTIQDIGSVYVNMQLYSAWIGRNEVVLLTAQRIRAEASKHVWMHPASIHTLGAITMNGGGTSHGFQIWKEWGFTYLYILYNICNYHYCGLESNTAYVHIVHAYMFIFCEYIYIYITIYRCMKHTHKQEIIGILSTCIYFLHLETLHARFQYIFI